MAFVLVTSLICLMLFIISLYILLVKGYFIFMSMLYSRKVRHLYQYNHLGKCICCLNTDTYDRLLSFAEYQSVGVRTVSLKEIYRSM